MEHATYQSLESAPCTIHSFEAVSIHAGGCLVVSLRPDGGMFAPTSFNVNAECCVLCGEIRLRIQHPQALRAAIEATEQHGKRRA